MAGTGVQRAGRRQRGLQGHYRLERERTPAQLARMVVYQKLARHRERARREAELGARAGNRIADAWVVRVMLAVPTVSMDTLAAFCAQFPRKEARTIGRTSVCRVRDAAAEVVKRLSGDLLRNFVDAQRTQPSAGVGVFFVPHVHDEAYMRTRSRDPPFSDRAPR